MQNKMRNYLFILGFFVIAWLITSLIILDASPVGQLYLPPYSQPDPKATGVYIGNNIVPTGMF
jgi:hypothetical protein